MSITCSCHLYYAYTMCLFRSQKFITSYIKAYNTVYPAMVIYMAIYTFSQWQFIV